MIKKTLLVAALSVASLGVQAATVIGGAGGATNSANFLDLSLPGVVTGGATYPQLPGTSGLPFATIPFNAAGPITTVGTWLAAGPNVGMGGDATLNLGGGIDYVSFLWGSPDDYNSLLVNTAGSGSFSFLATGLGLGLTVGGAPNSAGYVNFSIIGDTITSLVFKSTNANAFEASNVTAIPEPGTYAMLLAGLGVIGFVATRRRPTMRA